MSLIPPRTPFPHSILNFFHRFHPTTARVKAILDSGELGPIKNLIGTLAVPAGLFIKKGDIRLNYSLGGGAMMDMGCKSSPLLVLSLTQMSL